MKSGKREVLPGGGGGRRSAQKAPVCGSGAGPAEKKPVCGSAQSLREKTPVYGSAQSLRRKSAAAPSGRPPEACRFRASPRVPPCRGLLRLTGGTALPCRGTAPANAVCSKPCRGAAPPCRRDCPAFAALRGRALLTIAALQGRGAGTQPFHFSPAVPFPRRSIRGCRPAAVPLMAAAVFSKGVRAAAARPDTAEHFILGPQNGPRRAEAVFFSALFSSPRGTCHRALTRAGGKGPQPGARCCADGRSAAGSAPLILSRLPGGALIAHGLHHPKRAQHQDGRHPKVQHQPQNHQDHE